MKNNNTKYTKNLLIFIITCLLFTGISYIPDKIQNSDFVQQLIEQRNLESSTQQLRDEACENLDDILFDISDSDLKYAEKYRNGYYRSENRLEKIITNPDDVDAATEALEILSIIMPYLALSILSLFGYFCYYCCGCCPDSICPVCKICAGDDGKCCGCQCDRKALYERYELYVPLAGLFVTLLFTAIVAIVGIAKAPGMEEGYRSLHCVIIDTLMALNYGSTGWMGIQGFSDSLDKLLQDFDQEYKPSIKETFQDADVDWIQDSEQDMRDKLQVMRTNFQGLTTDLQQDDTRNFSYLIDPEGNGAVSKSCFFSDEVNPINCNYPDPQNAVKFFPMTDFMEQIIDETIKGSIETTQETQQKGEDIYTSVEEIENQIDTGKKDVDKFVKDMDQQIVDINDPLDQVKTIFVQLITPAIKNAFIALLVFTIIIAAVTGFMVAFKKYKVRYVLNFFWAFFSFLAFILFLVSGIFVAINVVGSELCDFLNRSLNDEAIFNTINVDGDTRRKLSICKAELGGDGEILTEFNVREELKKIDDLYKQIDVLTQEIANGQQGLDDLQTTLEDIVIYFEQLRDGGVVSGVSDHGGIINAVALINQTLQQVENITDQWISEKSECPSGFTPLETNYQFITDNSGNPGPEKDMQALGNGGQHCIWYNGHPYPNDVGMPQDVIDSWPDVGMGLENSLEQINGNLSRYRSGGVASLDSPTVQGYVTNLMNWRNSKNKVSFTKRVQTQDFFQAFANYKQNQIDYLNNIQTFSQDTEVTAKYITDPNEGLLAKDKTNCLFIGQQLDKFNDSMCVVFFPNFHAFTTTIIVSSFGLIFSSLFMFCTAQRFSKNESLSKKGVQVQPEGEKGEFMAAAGLSAAGMTPAMLDNSGMPLIQQIYDSNGQPRFCPDGQTPMQAIIDVNGNPILDEKGYPVTQQQYLDVSMANQQQYSQPGQLQYEQQPGQLQFEQQDNENEHEQSIRNSEEQQE